MPIHSKSLFVATLFLLACQPDSPPAQRQNHPPPSQLEEITVAQAGDFFLYAPLYVAVDAGLLRKRGISATLVSTGGDDKTWAAVIAGDAAFGVADPTFVAIADARGRGGMVVASIVNGVPFWGVTKDPRIPIIRDPRSLSRYTVATFPSPSTAYTLQRKMFVDAGLQPKIREGAFGTLWSIVNAGDADIALELEPNVSQAVSQSARVVYSLKDIYGDFAITGLTTTSQFLTDRPVVARKVICGLQDALQFIRSNPDSTLSLLRKRFPDVDTVVARAALTRVIQEGIVPDSVTTSPDAWEKAIRLRVESGDLQIAKPMNAYVASDFTRNALSACGQP